MKEITWKEAIKTALDGRRDIAYQMPLRSIEGCTISELRELAKEATFYVLGEQDPQEETGTPEKEADKEQKPKKRAEIDRGKVAALRKAGWKVKDIAEEMQCTETTIYTILKEAKEKEEQ